MEQTWLASSLLGQMFKWSRVKGMFVSTNQVFLTIELPLYSVGWTWEENVFVFIHLIKVLGTNSSEPVT